MDIEKEFCVGGIDDNSVDKVKEENFAGTVNPSDEFTARSMFRDSLEETVIDFNIRLVRELTNSLEDNKPCVELNIVDVTTDSEGKGPSFECSATDVDWLNATPACDGLCKVDEASINTTDKVWYLELCIMVGVNVTDSFKTEK